MNIDPETVNKKFTKLNNEVEKLDKPISTVALKHFGVIDQLIESRNDFTKELIDETPNFQTYLNKNYKSYFVPTYKKFVNYAFEEKEQQFYTVPKFGNISTLKILSQFDYLNKMTLCLKLPVLKLKKKYIPKIIQNIYNNLNISFDISEFNNITNEALLFNIKKKLQRKKLENQKNLIILNSILSVIENYSLNKDFDTRENFIILLSNFILSNSDYFNLNNGIYNFIVYLLNCIFNYKVDDYLIKSIFNDSYYFVNEIVTSVTSKKFLENKINGIYLLKKDKSIKLYKVEDDKLTEIQDEKYKIYLKSKKYKSSDNCYFVINGKLFTIDEIKLKVFEQQITNQQTQISEFNEYYNKLKDIILNSEDLILSDISEVVSNYKIMQEEKIISDFVDSFLFFYSSLKYLLKNLNNFELKENSETDDLIKHIQQLDYQLFEDDYRKINDENQTEFIKMIFNSYGYLKHYRFYELVKYLTFEDFINNKTTFKELSSEILLKISKYKNISIEKLKNSNSENYLINKLSVLDLLTNSDNLNYVDKNNFQNNLSSNNSDIFQSSNNNFNQYNFLNLDKIFDEQETIIQLEEDIQETLNYETIKNSFFSLLEDIITFVIPLFSDFSNIQENKILTIKDYLKEFVNEKIRNIENIEKKYSELFNDLSNNLINSLEYFTTLKYIDDIGINCFDYMEITINNLTLQKLGYEYYIIHKQIHETDGKTFGLKKMINGINGIVYLPLHFFFNDYLELSLPLLNLKQSEILFKIKFKNLQEIIKNPLITADLLSEDKFENFEFKSYVISKYVIIDQKISEKLIDKSLKLMINQFQYSKSFLLTSEINYIKLNFKNPIKYIIIYLNSDIKPFEHLQIFFENYPITEKIPADYYMLCSRYNSFNGSYYDNIYIINYSLYPEQLQPSGSLNYSLFNNKEIYFYFKDKYKNDSFNVQVYAFSYNFLNIDKGKCYLEFES